MFASVTPVELRDLAPIHVATTSTASSPTLFSLVGKCVVCCILSSSNVVWCFFFSLPQGVSISTATAAAGDVACSVRKSVLFWKVPTKAYVDVGCTVYCWRRRRRRKRKPAALHAPPPLNLISSEWHCGWRLTIHFSLILETSSWWCRSFLHSFWAPRVLQLVVQSTKQHRTHSQVHLPPPPRRDRWIWVREEEEQRGC